MARLEGRGRFAARREEDWTPEDVANWQYVHGVTQFVLPIYQSGISGSMLLSLVRPRRAALALFLETKCALNLLEPAREDSDMVPRIVEAM